MSVENTLNKLRECNSPRRNDEILKEISRSVGPRESIALTQDKDYSKTMLGLGLIADYAKRGHWEESFYHAICSQLIQHCDLVSAQEDNIVELAINMLYWFEGRIRETVPEFQTDWLLEELCLDKVNVKRYEHIPIIYYLI